MRSLNCLKVFATDGSVRPAAQSKPVRTALLRKASSLLLLALAVSLPFLAERPRPRISGRWFKGGNLLEARAGACAVSLPEGRMLVTGGQNRRGALNSAEYLGVSGDFTSISPMGVARSEHVCAPLPDGTVLVAGGRVAGDAATNAAEVYNPSSDTWAPIQSMREARIGATVTRLDDGRLLIAGGEASGVASTSLEIFDPAARTFDMVSGAMASPRKGHAASLLRGGRVLIAGGSDGTTVLDTAELFDPAAGTIRPVGKMTVAREGLSATLLDNHMVILAGGSNGREDLASSELFDANTSSFSPGPSMGSARRGHQAFLMPHNNTVIFVGGTSAGEPLASAEQFAWWGNRYRGQFKSIGDLSSPRTKTTGAPTQSGVLTVAGGAALGGSTLTETVNLSTATVTTDKNDYQPGDTVYLSGTGFGPNDVVHVVIHETPTTHPDVNVDVQADANGAFSNKPVYNVEVHDLGVTFHLIATGDPSGITAETSFTDGNVKVHGAPSGVTFTLIKTAYTGSTNCTTGAGSPTTVTGVGFSGGAVSTTGIGSTDSLKLQAATTSDQGGAFNNWTGDTGSTPSLPTTALTICVTGNFTGTRDYYANYYTAAAPSISKAFGASTISVGGTTTLTFTITNPNASTTLTGVAFSDPLPAGLEVDIPPATSNTCSGTFAPADGATTVSLTGGSIAGGGSCTIVVTVKGTTAGVKNNISGNVSSTNGGPGNTATASLTVIGTPSIAKAFGADTIALNGTTSLTFTITNPNSGTSLTGVAFTDTLPAGLVVNTPSGLSALTGCGAGVATAADGSGSVSLSGATIAASGTCTFSVNAKGTTAGVKNNVSGAVTSTNGGTGNTASDDLTVISPPSISKEFGADTIALNGVTSLSFTITNPNSGTSLTGVGFTDTLPAGLVVNTPSGLSALTGCGAGVATAADGSGSVSLSGATIAASGTCTFSVNVKGTTDGVKNNVSGAVSSTNGGTGNTASDDLTVIGPPSISKEFGADTIALNGVTSLSFTITNPNSATSLTGVGFTDTLPAGLVVNTPSGLSPLTSCGAGIATAADGSGSVSLSGATIAASGTCTFSVNVKGTTAGVKNNVSGAVSSTNGGTGNTASDNVTVVAPPSISKEFGAETIPLNSTTSLTFTITNPNGTVALTGVAFTDTLPSGLVVNTPSGLSALTGCGAGVATAADGSGSVSLSGATIAASGTCTFSVNVKGTAAGVKNNVTGAVSSTNGGSGNTASDSITVIDPPSISKEFGAETIALNGTTSLSFTISNPNTTVALTGVAFTDALPGGLVVDTPNGLSGPTGCGAGVVTAVAGTGSISLSGATIAASGTCTFSVNVKGTSGGVKNNVSGAVSSTNGGTGNTASDSLTVVAPPSIGKAFGASTINITTSTSLTFTITNPNGTVALTGVGFTDTLPGGLVVATPNGLSGPTGCGAGAVTAVAGSGSISLSGATIAASGTCTFSVNVTGTTIGIKNNVSGNVTSTNGGTGNTASASVTVVQPTVTTIDGDAVQCTDVVTLTANVSPIGSPGSVEFFVNNISIGNGTYTPATGVATKAYTCVLGAGSYPIKATYIPSDPLYLSSFGTYMLTVTKENAIVTPSPANPLSVMVPVPGGNSGAFSLIATIAEESDASQGDISNATPVTCTLTPLGPGSPIVDTATTTGGGVGGTLTAQCDFTNVPVNVYEVTFSVGGNCYQGSATSALTVYDPSLGFTTGGGKLVRTGTGYMANFGFNDKYLKNGQNQGSLLYLEHRPTGDMKLKSNSMGSLAIIGNTAIFDGKATLNGVGNYKFRVTVVDNGEPGTNDTFKLEVWNPAGAVVADLTFPAPITISGGNIQVPQPSGKK